MNNVKNIPKSTAKTNKSYKVSEGGGLLECARRELAHLPSGKVKSLLEHRQLAVDGVIYTQFDHPVNPGQTITVLADGSPKSCPLPIIYEDEFILVVDKPAGLLVVANDGEKLRTAYRMIKDAGFDPLWVVHRLDRDTSGILIFAKSREVRDVLQASWENVRREYIAICEGLFDEKKGRCDTYLTEDVNHMVYSSSRGKRAITDYEVVSELDGYSLLHINIKTGRKNQIRVHMKELGHPVVGDKKYGSSANPLGRLALHSSLLGIRHPVTGSSLMLNSPVPMKLKLKNLKRIKQENI